MYDKIEKQMRQAVRAGRVVLATHLRQNFVRRNFTAADLENCFETGSIVEHQYDGDEVKYIWHGEAEDGRETGLVTKLTYTNNVFVLTIFWVQLSDYE